MPDASLRLADLQYGSQIATALQQLAKRSAEDGGYQLYQRYYDGNHPMKYVSQKFRDRFGAALAGLADNLCPLVVDTIAGRLILDSFSGAEEQADELLSKARFDALQRLIHRDAILFGDGYAIVWDGGDGPRPYRQRPWLIAPIYDESDPEQMIAAVKSWIITPKNGDSTSKSRRITIYYRDRVERYITDQADITDAKNLNLRPLHDEEGAVQIHTMGRVPVFHWANGEGRGDFGRSELKAVIPLQSLINKALYDLVVGMEAVSWPQRFAVGVETYIDPETGQPADKMPASKLWTFDNAEAKVGQLDGADARPILEVVESTRMEISRVSGVPSYFFAKSGDTPSGAALRVTESPLQTKVEDRQVAFGNVWEDLVGTMLGKSDAQISAVWRDTAPISEMELLEQGESLKRLGLPQAYILQRVLNLTEEEATRLAAEGEAEAEARADMAAKRLTRAPELQ